MIVIINGSLGVGKSSVAEQIHWKFNKSICLDGDHIGNVHPFEIYDDARIDHLYQTLAHLIAFHQKFSYSNFVINYVFESADSLQNLINLLSPLDSDIHTYWLTCNKDIQAKRIQKRDRGNGEYLDWELNRFLELQEIQRQAAHKGFIGTEVNTTHLSLEDVAAKIWTDIHA